MFSKNIYTIYKATNIITNKVYIGFDSNWPKRISGHKTASLTKPYKFYNAIRKYGWDNFTWEIVYQSTDREYTLKTMESYFIHEYNSVENGYNTTYGGEGTIGHTWKLSEEYKKSISGEKSHRYGTKLSDDAKLQLSISRIGENNPNFGKKLSESTIQKRTDKQAKIWKIIDPIGNEFIIKNLNKFCKENNLDSGNMSKVASGKQSYYKGYSCIKLVE